MNNSIQHINNAIIPPKTQKPKLNLTPSGVAWATWYKQNIGQCDVAVALHLPMHLAHKPNPTPLKGRLRQLLNRLDTHFFGRQYHRNNQRIPRLVMLEYSPDCGWHAHMAIKLTKNGHRKQITVEEMQERIKKYWLLINGAKDAFAERGVYAQPQHGNYVGYMLKTEGKECLQGELDIFNTCADKLRLTAQPN